MQKTLQLSRINIPENNLQQKAAYFISITDKQYIFVCDFSNKIDSSQVVKIEKFEEKITSEMQVIAVQIKKPKISEDLFNVQLQKLSFINCGQEFFTFSPTTWNQPLLFQEILFSVCGTNDRFLMLNSTVFSQVQKLVFFDCGNESFEIHDASGFSKVKNLELHFCAYDGKCIITDARLFQSLESFVMKKCGSPLKKQHARIFIIDSKHIVAEKQLTLLLSNLVANADQLGLGEIELRTTALSPVIQKLSAQLIQAGWNVKLLV